MILAIIRIKATYHIIKGLEKVFMISVKALVNSTVSNRLKQVLYMTLSRLLLISC